MPFALRQNSVVELSGGKVVRTVLEDIPPASVNLIEAVLKDNGGQIVAVRDNGVIAAKAAVLEKK